MTETNQGINDNPQPVMEERTGCLGWFLALVLPLIVVGPLMAILFKAYENQLEFIYLLMFFPVVLFYFVAVGWLAKKFKRPVEASAPTWKANDASAYLDDDQEARDRDAEQAAAFTGGLLGGYFLGKHVGKNHKSFSDKMRDDIFWQEKYRRHDHHDDGEDW